MFDLLGSEIDTAIAIASGVWPLVCTRPSLPQRAQSLIPPSSALAQTSAILCWVSAASGSRGGSQKYACDDARRSIRFRALAHRNFVLERCRLRCGIGKQSG